jgi:hypothetical protein
MVTQGLVTGGLGSVLVAGGIGGIAYCERQLHPAPRKQAPEPDWAQRGLDELHARGGPQTDAEREQARALETAHAFELFNNSHSEQRLGREAAANLEVLGHLVCPGIAVLGLSMLGFGGMYIWSPSSFA